jgi:hypothetical protein
LNNLASNYSQTPPPKKRRDLAVWKRPKVAELKKLPSLGARQVSDPVKTEYGTIYPMSCQGENYLSATDFEIHDDNLNNWLQDYATLAQISARTGWTESSDHTSCAKLIANAIFTHGRVRNLLHIFKEADF